MDSLSERITDWKVEEKESMNDHNYITYDLILNSEIHSIINKEEALYCTKEANWQLFDMKFGNNFELFKNDLMAAECCDDIEKFAKNLNICIKNSCDDSMTLKKKFLKSNGWWTQKIFNKRKTVNKFRKIFQKEKNLNMRQIKKAEYYQHKKEYERLILESKSWQNFCTSRKPWDLPYKLSHQK